VLHDPVALPVYSTMVPTLASLAVIEVFVETLLYGALGTAHFTFMMTIPLA